MTASTHAHAKPETAPHAAATGSTTAATVASACTPFGVARTAPARASGAVGAQRALVRDGYIAGNGFQVQRIANVLAQ